MKDVLLSTQGPYVIRWYLNDGAGDLGPAFIVDTLITAVTGLGSDMNGTGCAQRYQWQAMDRRHLVLFTSARIGSMTGQGASMTSK
ncbi:MAG: hypothetical protein IPG69_03805 [Flavobacteriales bacterium]|nr:hypothetical protein [Flavobacteriales bacterium]